MLRKLCAQLRITPDSCLQSISFQRHCAVVGPLAKSTPQLRGNMRTASSYEDRVIGTVLGAMCGDVLGASVEGWDAKRIQASFPDGLTEFQETDRGYGCYTDDSQMLLALAASLVNKGHSSLEDSTEQYVLAFDPERGYGGSAVKILQRLSQGADPASTGSQFLPQGSFGNGGAMRIAPVGLAYRNADLSVLQTAVQSVVMCTHVHPLGIEGAVAQALAVAELSKMQHVSQTVSPAAAAADPGQQQQQWSQALEFLQKLQQKLTGVGEEMCEKLSTLEDAYQQMPCFKPSTESWSSYLTGPGWAAELAVSGQVAPGFQIKATDAVAAAVWASVLHWDCPCDAVVAAVHYGGDTDTIACMTGALMGALHGSSWIPSSWLDNLENDNKTDFFSWASGSSTRSKQKMAQGAANMSAVDSIPSARNADSSGGDHEPQQLVHTTRDMGKDAAMLLAKLLFRLDCRG